MIKAVQCNAEQLAGRVIKKDSRSHPLQFRDPHWNQNPRMSSFLLKGNGHPLRSGINYMRSSPRTTYLVSPQTSNEHMLEKTHLTLFQKNSNWKTSIALYWIPAAKRWTPPYWILLLWQTQTSLQTQRHSIENISFHKQRGRLLKGSTRFIRAHTTVLLHTLKKDCWFSTSITIPTKQRIHQTQRHSFTSDNWKNCRNASLWHQHQNETLTFATPSQNHDQGSKRSPRPLWKRRPWRLRNWI